MADQRMKTADDIIRELESRRNQGIGIERFQQYLHTLDDPQNTFSSIHIAGTNGKGSTLNYLRSIYQEANLRVGTFSSPYLETHYDRIRINDAFISEQDFIGYYEQYYEEWVAMGFGSFEIDTLIAFLYFRDQKVDLAIIETGIGGRYDCTNVITPIVSVITNIGKDHMDRLGSSLQKIAWQKGGIIKAHVPLVTAETNPECLHVFETICQELHSPMYRISEIHDVKQTKDGLAYTYDHMRFTLSNRAWYQLRNSACAIETVLICNKYYHRNLDKTYIQKGIAQAVWKGRFETVWENPLIIIDGAHNEDGIRALCDTLQSWDEIQILFSALKDKDTHRMMELLCECSKQVYVSEFDNPRAKSAKDLAEHFPVRIADYHRVIDKAIKADSMPLIITGSLYFISEVRSYLMHKKKNEDLENAVY